MKKFLLLIFFIAFAIFISAFTIGSKNITDAFQSRSVRYKNGTYYGQSQSEYTAEPYWGQVSISVKRGKIAGVDFIVRDSAKHETFSEKYERHFATIPEYVEQCRNDWKGIQTYPKKFLENQNLSKVDAITGATWSYNLFRDSAEEALKKASK
jgi:major membrane immunogen (membrane-anchored lipoprotein)